LAGSPAVPIEGPHDEPAALEPPVAEEPPLPDFVPPVPPLD
jgi:hypothetical protein